MTDRDEFAKAAMNERKDKMTIDKKAYAGDVVSRLRNWRGLHLAHGGELFEEAAAEIERLRLAGGDAEVARLRLAAAHAEIVRLRQAIRRLAEQDATLSVCDGNVTVTMDATLTAAERSLLTMLVDHPRTHELMYDEEATLRGLLERTKRGEQ